MLKDDEAIRSSGIVPAHARAFITVASEMKAFIVVRPVNPLSTSLIEDDYATKDMHVKGKSSDFGPQAGFICVDQSLSKLAGKAPEEVPKYNHKVRDSLAEGFHSVPLLISQARLDELVRRRVLPALSPHGRGGYTVEARGSVFLLSPVTPESAPNDARRQFEKIKSLRAGKGFAVLVRTGASFDHVYVVAEKKGEMFKVPLTADYDLYAACPHLSRYANQYKFQTAVAQTTGKTAATARFQAAGNAVKSALGTDDRKKFSPDFGVMTMFQGQVKDRMNAAVRGLYNGGNLVHHGPEVNNPAPEQDYPLTVFSPGGTIYGVETQVELENLAADMDTLGFVFYGNRAWFKQNAPLTWNDRRGGAGAPLKVLKATDGGR